MKSKGIIILCIAVLAVLLGVLSFAGHLKAKKSLFVSVPRTMWGPGQLNTMFWSFKLKYSRWPKNIAEFRGYLKTSDETNGLDLSSFQNLKFAETPRKTLKVHYDSFKGGNDSEGPTDEEINISFSKKDMKGS